MPWGLPQQKVVAMIEEEDGQELMPWQCLYNYDNKITRACLRLEQIRDSERVLGYEESAQMYHDTATELRTMRAWWHDVFSDSVKKPDTEVAEIEVEFDGTWPL